MELIEILKVIFLGIIEGITEWLPVSSTGHILLAKAFFPLNAREEFITVFLYVVQLGAILAVVLLFWNKLFPFSLTRETQSKNPAPATENRGKIRLFVEKDTFTLWGKILVACIPAAVIGLLFDIPDNSLLIAIALIFYGVAFILMENWNKTREFQITTTSGIMYKHALVIGLFQVLSIIPGTSRSGITILAALLLGISRPAGAEFTFFLAIPVMVGASLIKTLDFIMEVGWFTGVELGYLFIGTLTAFAVSLLVIKFLMDFIKKHDFKIFGWYRIALGVLVITTLVLPPLFA